MAGETVGYKKEKTCLQLKVKGTVQGIGFRPYVFNLAQKFNLKGWIRNESGGVLLEIEGDEQKIISFCQELISTPPSSAKIERVEQKKVPLRNFQKFEIASSQVQQERNAFIPPDLAVCRKCLDEIMDPEDRHYLYPFTNCTHCGPRFTIVENIPYDRDKTSMRSFPPCHRCRKEYNDPGNRRFHAQPVACPSCGPQLEIKDARGNVISLESNWLDFFWKKMSQGNIFAVKGLGGFHLACITREDVVQTLRNRKRRPFKPFAVMCKDLETVKKYCYVEKEEAELLSSPSAPVVLLQQKEDVFLPDNINPGLSTLGVMLPYTPLHYLLLQGPFDIMILTSANPTDLPILKDNEEAEEQLKDIADFFMLHNRAIVQRCDDSVVRMIEGEVQIQRRSRGFVPQPIKLGFRAETTVLGAGAEMKNTFCLLKDDKALLSQHLGEMGTLESDAFFRESLEHFLRFFALEPQVIGYDLHPGYQISYTAKALPVQNKYPVQHHHAHFASCLAENHFAEKAIGIILDGTGYGLDGAIWGFEIITGNFVQFKREYHQSYTLLPGGEAAIKWPWRMGLSFLLKSMGEEGLSVAHDLFASRFARELSILEKGIASLPYALPTSSCGRLFDAVAALLGVCFENTYEGQAAIQLGELLDMKDTALPLDPFPFIITEKEIDFCPMFPVLVAEIKRGVNSALLARRFHDTVVAAIMAAVKEISFRTGINVAALSGGTWHNPYLLKKVVNILSQNNIKSLIHRNVPPNDGGLSLGQAAVAYWRWKSNVPGDTHEGS